MNAVDTADQRRERGTCPRIAKEHEFQTPIDEEDAAARCVAPILEGARRRGTPFGKFFKDYPRASGDASAATRARRERRAPLVSYVVV